MDQDSDLESSWTLYENYYVTNKRDYAANLQKVVDIDSVEELCFLLSSTVYSGVTGLFTQHPSGKIRVFNRPDPITLSETEGQDVVIDALCIFRTSIRPEWEHPKNKLGGELQFEIDAKYLSKLDGFYKDLVMEILGASNPVSKRVNGIRILDKLRGIPAHIRLDLWIDFNPKHQEFYAMKHVLVSLVSDLLQEHEIIVELKQISHS